MKKLWYAADHVRHPAMWRLVRQMESSQSVSWHEAAAPWLSELLSWSQLHVPAYRGGSAVLKGNGVSDVPDLLETLPIITRRSLTDDPVKYTSDVLQASARWQTTGGSTGIPMRLLQDARDTTAKNAAMYFSYLWAGWKPSDRILKVWGSYAEAMGDHPTARERLAKWLLEVHQLDAFALRAGDTARYFETIERMKPAIVYSYVDAAETLAQFMNAGGIRLSYTPRSVLVTVGTLFPEWRKDIEHAFGCPVFNLYGSRESGCIASSHGGDPLYVNPLTSVVEVVDVEGRRITQGTGRMLVTVLNNFSMPLIRYDIGDYATIESGESLYPEDGWQRLESIDGRNMTMLQGPDGTRFSALLIVKIMRASEEKPLFSQYQIIQEGLKAYAVRLKLRPECHADDPSVLRYVDTVRHAFLRVLGSDARIGFEYVDQIEALPSGKVPFCIARLDDCSGRVGP